MEVALSRAEIMKVFLANSLELNIFRRQMWRKRNNSKLHNYDQRSYLMCA